jgi:hypothetical protein
MKMLLVLLTLVLTTQSFTQSKKEQIVILETRVDSLNSVLLQERNSSNQRIQELNTKISSLESKITTLNTNLTDLKKEAAECKTDTQRQQLKMADLIIQIESKTDSLGKLRLEIETLNEKIQNISGPSFGLLSFDELYPILKKSLLEIVCESYTVQEGKNGLSVYSRETKMLLSSWEWNLTKNPLTVKDIDNDGQIDYTIELSNIGGGCGGQLAQEERWTLFGSKPDIFIWTHLIPYRSTSGSWEKN